MIDFTNEGQTFAAQVVFRQINEIKVNIFRAGQLY